jgi:hypothetical protein
LDAVVIKVSEEEALYPMKKEILNAAPKAIEVVRKAVKRGKKNERIMVIGVGNTCGVGNNSEEVKVAEERLKKLYREMKKITEKRKKKRILPW